MKQFCAPTEHEYQALQEPISSGWWYSYSSRTLLYCRKCGHHFYVKRTPQDYASSSTGQTITWSPPLTSYSVTLQLLNSTSTFHDNS